MFIKKIYPFFFVLLFFSACQPTKYLGKNELLYNGATIVKSKPKKDQPGRNLRTELSYKVRQQPNKKIFGQRFKLWVYQQYINHDKEKGLRHWLKTKIGEPPVVYSHRLTEQSRLSIQQYLRDNGFLNATVSVDTTIKNRVIDVKYSVKGNGQFSIHSYIIPPDTTRFLALINQKIKKPRIQPGAPYSLRAIDAERLRIENLARGNGFFEFDQSSLYFYLDTTITENRKLDIYLSIKPPADQKNYKRYQLGNVNIYPDYSLNSGEVAEKKDTIRTDNWQVIQSKRIVKLKTLQAAIAQDSGAVYSEYLERQTINYLLDLDVFKYINLKYEMVMVDSQPVLNRNFYLTPSLNQDFDVGLEASTERTNFLGYSAGVNYTHRNLFRGAENFKTGLSLGAETQAGGDGPFINTLEVNFNSGLSIPRLLLPFKISNRLKGVIPKTLINVNGSYQQRNTLFTSASMLTEFGYTWKQKQHFQHQFYPFQFTFLKLINTSTDFENELIANPRLRASFDDLIIFAADYRFFYSNQSINTQNNYFYFRGEIETAGNIASLAGQQNANNPNGPKTFFNTPIAQFTRFQAEARYTWYQPKTSIVTRLSTGIALSYGNSVAVPYVRQ
ncbi:MAG: outer membrane protein insertion porin family, partial [Saprospiraceae bacterium]